MAQNAHGNLKFSIILPTYNRVDFLDRSVGSVLKQDYERWELIIVDDGSTDNTSQKVESIHDDRVRYVQQPHSGLPAARNRGIEVAKGDYVCFLDSDDEYKSNHLSVLHQEITLNQEPVAFLYTLSIKVKNNKYERIHHNDIESGSIKIDDYPEVNSVCVHKNILKEYKFNEDIKIYEDMELWSRICASYPCIRIEKYTTLFYKHEGNMVSNALRRAEGMKRVYELVFSTLDERIPIPPEMRREKMFKVRVGLADAYSQENRVSEALSYLLKAVHHRPSFIFTRHFLGIVRNILVGSK